MAEEPFTAGFKSYLKDLGLKDGYYLTVSGNGADRIYHYHGKRDGIDKNGQTVKDIGTDISFDPGTIKDGTYNILLSDNHHTSDSFGVIKPGKNGDYALSEKSEPVAKLKNTEPPAKNTAAGKYKMYLVRDDETNTEKKETGVITIVDAKDSIVWEGKYVSGPWGQGHAPHVEHYHLAEDIKEFTCAGKEGRKQDGLRILNKSFQGLGRDGILIHQDNGVMGTLGCFGIQGDKSWRDFSTEWKKINKAQKPSEMHPMSKEDFAKLKAKPVRITIKTTQLDESAVPLSRPVIKLAQDQSGKPFSDGFSASPTNTKLPPPRTLA